MPRSPKSPWTDGTERLVTALGSARARLRATSLGTC